MDMKKILQALDGASTKPVEGSNDMKKFMQIVTEGANPHKVSLPVQMAMQHYQEEKVPSNEIKESRLKKYFAEAEQEVLEQATIKEQQLRMYSRKIANRVLVKESASIYDIFAEEPEISTREENPEDTVTMDIPLLIRLLEYAREDAKTDMDLHNVTDMLIDLSKEGDTLTMQNYDQIVGDQKMLPAPTNEACWKSHKQIGMKKKGNKQVPSCVPKKGK